MMKLHTALARRRLLRRATKRDVVPLNLVSMIDIFTTLVFFLLITSTSVQVLRNPPNLVLPNSTTLQAPNDTPVLMVTEQSILLNGKPLMSTAEARATPGEVLGPVKSELLQVSLLPIETDRARLTRGEINIMADKDIPYELLKKVMKTCAEAQFARISMSVNHHGRRAS
jgi:biopolymer transport protein ExbD